MVSGTIGDPHSFCKQLFGPTTTFCSPTLISTDHVISPQNVRLHYQLSTDWTFRRLQDYRAKHAQLTQAFHTVLKYAEVIRGGILVFFTNKQLVSDAYKCWNTIPQYYQNASLFEILFDNGDKEH